MPNASSRVIPNRMADGHQQRLLALALEESRLNDVRELTAQSPVAEPGQTLQRALLLVNEEHERGRMRRRHPGSAG